ncbi:MAG: DUF805 domain-containing protein [Asticcacaulis sp.]
MFNALFSARSRMRRRDWWLWSIAVGIAIYAATAILDNAMASGVLIADEEAFRGWPKNGFEYGLILLTLLGQFIAYCLTAKRWQDRNRPGWFAGIGAGLNLLYFTLVHFAGGGLEGGFVARFTMGTATMGVLIASGIYGLWLLIDCGILDGTPGPNRYGPSPKGLGAQQADVF